MNRNKIIWLIAVIAIVSVVVAYFKSKQTPVTKELIKIGIILPLTGDAASYGKSLQEGIIVADSFLKDSVNLEIFYEDSKADPQSAVSAINKLISADKVNLLIGDMFTSTTLAIAPIAEKNNIMLLSPTGSANEISKGKKQVFRIYPSEVEEGNALSSFYKEKCPNQKFAIIFANEDAMKNVVKTIKVNLGDSLVIYESSFSKGIADFKSILSRIPKNIKNIFIIGYLNDATLFVKQSKELNKDFLFFGISTLYDKQFIELTKGASDEIYMTAPFFSTKSENSAVQKFIAMYSKIYKKEPDVWAGYGYDALNIAVKAWKDSKSKGIEPYKAMELLQNYDGVTGVISIKPDHSINKQFNIVQIIEGNFQIQK